MLFLHFSQLQKRKGREMESSWQVLMPWRDVPGLPPPRHTATAGTTQRAGITLPVHMLPQKSLWGWDYIWSGPMILPALQVPHTFFFNFSGYITTWPHPSGPSAFPVLTQNLGWGIWLALHSTTEDPSHLLSKVLVLDQGCFCHFHFQLKFLRGPQKGPSYSNCATTTMLLKVLFSELYS